jgi:hypothetical protein
MGYKGFFMKNLLKYFGIAALVAAIGFSMTGCPTEPVNPPPGGGGGDGGGGGLGATLNLVDQLVTIDSSATGCTATNFGYDFYKDQSGNVITFPATK